jgi:predicted small metal-binding protein
MRALDCECGKHLKARDDDELYGQVREHVDRDHPEMRLSDEQVMGIVAGALTTSSGGSGPGRTSRGPL